jgi:hypothetical protein
MNNLSVWISFVGLLLSLANYLMSSESLNAQTALAVFACTTIVLVVPRFIYACRRHRFNLALMRKSMVNPF